MQEFFFIKIKFKSKVLGYLFGGPLLEGCLCIISRNPSWEAAVFLVRIYIFRSAKKRFFIFFEIFLTIITSEIFEWFIFAYHQDLFIPSRFILLSDWSFFVLVKNAKLMWNYLISFNSYLVLENSERKHHYIYWFYDVNLLVRVCILHKKILKIGFLYRR